jgi:hypothetical protein
VGGEPLAAIGAILVRLVESDAHSLSALAAAEQLTSTKFINCGHWGAERPARGVSARARRGSSGRARSGSAVQTKRDSQAHGGFVNGESRLGPGPLHPAPP